MERMILFMKSLKHCYEQTPNINLLNQNVRIGSNWKIFYEDTNIPLLFKFYMSVWNINYQFIKIGDNSEILSNDTDVFCFFFTNKNTKDLLVKRFYKILSQIKTFCQIGIITIGAEKIKGTEEGLSIEYFFSDTLDVIQEKYPNFLFRHIDLDPFCYDGNMFLSIFEFITDNNDTRICFRHGDRFVHKNFHTTMSNDQAKGLVYSRYVKRFFL